MSARLQLHAYVTFVGLCVFALVRRVVRAARRPSSRIRMRLVCTDGINEVLLVDARLNGTQCLFLVDTGYAGPPVLSASYLAVPRGLLSYRSLDDEYARTLQAMEGNAISQDAQHQAIDTFLAHGGCMSYTSGCTMRLMSIGATQEQQADLLMCNMLEMRDVNGLYSAPKAASTEAHADLFVTHSLPNSVHILTCDYLRHASPCYLNIADEELRFNLPSIVIPSMVAMSVAKVKLDFSGGALVVPIDVGGRLCRCTMDTGAPGPVCLGASMATQVQLQGAAKHFRQQGVNGETVCSNMGTCTVSIGGVSFEDMPVIVNNTDIEQVDGYVGLGLLRAFNILICSDGVYFISSGLPARMYSEYERVSREGVCPTK